MSMKPEEKKLREELIGAEDTATFQRNYLVEAGAGAGKTYTMVRRIANHLVSGACEPENLVAITFTKKATEEMRGRLDSRLAELLDYAKNGERDESGTKLPVDEKDRRVRRLTHLVRNAGRMQISTIHSFCQTMLSIMPFASPQTRARTPAHFLPDTARIIRTPFPWCSQGSGFQMMRSFPSLRHAAPTRARPLSPSRSPTRK